MRRRHDEFRIGWVHLSESSETIKLTFLRAVFFVDLYENEVQFTYRLWA